MDMTAVSRSGASAGVRRWRIAGIRIPRLGRLLLLAAAGLVIFELGIFHATGSIYNPTPIPIQFGTPQSYTITVKYENPAPQMEGPAKYIYVIVNNRVVMSKHLGFTPPQISDATPSDAKKDWLQASDVVISHGSLTIAVHGRMVSYLRGQVVISAKPLHQTTKGGGPLLVD
jgi:hypothetical protein